MRGQRHRIRRRRPSPAPQLSRRMVRRDRVFALVVGGAAR